MTRETPENDPDRAIDVAISYFQNNRSVKGTEMFWNDGPTGEAILQVRAALLCDDDR